MCGIVGAVASSGEGTTALSAVLDGLGRLQYRGYDSAGVAVVGAHGLEVRKRAGKLTNLLGGMEPTPRGEGPLRPGTASIGHTRWATHGAPTDANAHPHLSQDGAVALVHNGIVENAAELRVGLVAEGDAFTSQTDTEVVAHLLGHATLRTGDLTAAMRTVIGQLEGSFTLVAVHAGDPHTIVAARRNSPLVVGLGEGANYLGSDVAAFVAHTRRALDVGQDQVVTLTGDRVVISDAEGAVATPCAFTVEWEAEAAVKGGFPTFMDKEIHEQPKAVADTLLGRLDEGGRLRLDELRIDEAVLRSVDKLVVIACGTAAYAGHVAKYAIERWCRIPVEVELAHEFRYRDPVLGPRTLVVAISQSGETMDTIMAVRYARERGAKVLAIVNTAWSTLSRESDAVLGTRAGPEVAVASTKAFLTQITACYLLGLYLAELRGTLAHQEIAAVLERLGEIPGQIQQVLDRGAQVRSVAESMADARTVLFLGRHVGFPVALEGALKVKELTYIHAEGFAAGELKHGPIALVEKGLPVFVVVPSPRDANELHAKVVSSIQEIRARGARTLVIAEEGDEGVSEFADVVFRVPPTPPLLAPLVSVVPLQLFASALAAAKGYDVDQPRNLAKSVTVE